jgi:hypothetical protein
MPYLGNSTQHSVTLIRDNIVEATAVYDVCAWQVQVIGNLTTSLREFQALAGALVFD